MEDSTLFMQWAMTMLQQEHPAGAAPVVDDRGEATFPSLQALREASQAAEIIHDLVMEGHADAANSWSSGSGDGDANDGSSISARPAMEHDIWPPSPNTAGPTSSRSSSATNVPMSWNFSAVSAQPGGDGTAEFAAARDPPELGYVSPPATARAGSKSAGSKSMPSPYLKKDHIIAERKRREKINQRFIELSTLIPGLKKMDKATILSDATRYVKELQEKLKALEDGSNCRSAKSAADIKKPCITVLSDGGSSSPESSGTPPARKPLPEIDARFSEKSVMVRIHCEDGKGVVVRVLAEVEELHLSIIHTNVTPFSACTLIITITAKATASILRFLREVAAAGIPEFELKLPTANFNIELTFTRTFSRSVELEIQQPPVLLFLHGVTKLGFCGEGTRGAGISEKESKDGSVEEMGDIATSWGLLRNASLVENSLDTRFTSPLLEVEEGFAVTAQEIVGRLKSALFHQHSSCNSTKQQN
ncbi:hypothetical protein ACP70R_009669 [Stipagrostis hirtigluma subsp. patula]